MKYQAHFDTKNYSLQLLMFRSISPLLLLLDLLGTEEQDTVCYTFWFYEMKAKFDIIRYEQAHLGIYMHSKDVIQGEFQHKCNTTLHAKVVIQKF